MDGNDEAKQVGIALHRYALKYARELLGSFTLPDTQKIADGVEAEVKIYAEDAMSHIRGSVEIYIKANVQTGEIKP